MLIVKLRDVGGNLALTIPRALARELGWLQHNYLTVERGADGAVIVKNLETHLADAKRLRAHPLEPNSRTESPTAREDRARGAG